MPRIRRLDVQGFRGIRKDVPLVFDGKSILLFGENGTGKSSFVDAIEKLFTGRVSTLDGLAQGVSSERHGPHIQEGGKPPRIGATFDNPEESMFTQDTDIGNLPRDVRDYLESAKENLYVLRRRQVLRFIDSQPRERYELLRPFLLLPDVDAIESSLRQASEQAEELMRQKREQADRLAHGLTSELGDTSLPPPLADDDLASRVNSLLKTSGQDEISDVFEVDKAIRQLDAALAPFGETSYQVQVTIVEVALSALVRSMSGLRLDDVVANLDRLKDRETLEARVFYESVLEQGILWIEEEGRNTCPLCQQSIDPTRVVSITKERLEAMRELVELRKTTHRSIEQSRHSLQTCLTETSRAAQLVESLQPADIGNVPKILKEIEHAGKQIATAFSAVTQSVSGEQARLVGALAKATSDLLPGLREEVSRLGAILSALPSAERAQHLLRTRSKLLRIKELWPDLQSIRRHLRGLEELHRLTDSICKHAEAARKQGVQELFNELSNEIDSFYQSIHPGENLGDVRLTVRDVGQGSANLRVNYHDRNDEDPRGYFSDAHLDTLGFCIFLSLRNWYRKQRPEFDLLVLDDVFTSVDAHHVVRVSELLLRQFSDYQVLLTTHDRIWFEHLRDIQARCGVANNFINKVIHKWSVEEGPDIREPPDEREALDRLIADGSAQDIAGMAGRLLEHILQEMRYALRLTVPAKPGEQYEIGDLWPTFYRSTKKDYATFYQQTRKSMDALDVRWPIRNWIGAHRNNWARNAPRTTAVEFAEAVKELFDNVYCAQCRRFISPSATPLGQLACKCGHKVYAATGKQPVYPKSRAELVRETQGALRDAKLDTETYLAWKSQESRRDRNG